MAGPAACCSGRRAPPGSCRCNVGGRGAGRPRGTRTFQCSSLRPVPVRGQCKAGGKSPPARLRRSTHMCRTWSSGLVFFVAGLQQGRRKQGMPVETPGAAQKQGRLQAGGGERVGSCGRSLLRKAGPGLLLPTSYPTCPPPAHQTHGFTSFRLIILLTSANFRVFFAFPMSVHLGPRRSWQGLCRARPPGNLLQGTAAAPICKLKGMCVSCDCMLGAL